MWKNALESLEDVIFDLNEDNIDESVESALNLCKTFSSYSDRILSTIIYSSFVAQMKDFNLYLNFILKYEARNNKYNHKLIKVFAKFLLQHHTPESFYLLNKLIEHNFILPNVVKVFSSFYFAHYFNYSVKTTDSSYIKKNYVELSKNDWELHKRYVNEGFNPTKIAQIIRNDDLDKLRELYENKNFYIDKTIKKSIYEVHGCISFKKLSLIEYAAFFGSIKCFIFLLEKGASLCETGQYAVANGNPTIIQLCKQFGAGFNGSYENAIRFHRNDIFKVLYKSNLDDCDIDEILNYFTGFPHKCYNIKIFNFLLEQEGFDINAFFSINLSFFNFFLRY